MQPRTGECPSRSQGWSLGKRAPCRGSNGAWIQQVPVGTHKYLPDLANPGSKKATGLTKTMYQAHPHPAPSCISVPRPVFPPAFQLHRSTGLRSSFCHPQSKPLYQCSTRLVVIAYIRCVPLELLQIGRASMAPPELSRNAPILHVLHPSDPVIRRRFRSDLNFAVCCSLTGVQIPSHGQESHATLSASSAIARQLIHHWGFMICSTTSPDRLWDFS